ncbi:hypothetical protein Ancab_001229 [Ancistrocladus abbreviatus]
MKVDQDCYSCTCSGTIVECERDENNGMWIGTALTSASIFSLAHSPLPLQPEDHKVKVYLADGNSCEGQVHGFLLCLVYLVLIGVDLIVKSFSRQAAKLLRFNSEVFTNMKKGESLRLAVTTHCPWLGMELTNLYAARLELLEKLLQKDLDIREGVVVEKGFLSKVDRRIKILIIEEDFQAIVPQVFEDYISNQNLRSQSFSQQENGIEDEEVKQVSNTHMENQRLNQ